MPLTEANETDSLGMTNSSVTLGLTSIAIILKLEVASLSESDHYLHLIIMRGRAG